MDQNMTDARRDRYVAVAVELLDLNVLRAHDRLVADDVATRFMAVADEEQAEITDTLTKVLGSLQAMASRVGLVEAALDEWGVDDDDAFAESIQESGAWRLARDLRAALDDRV